MQNPVSSTQSRKNAPRPLGDSDDLGWKPVNCSSTTTMDDFGGFSMLEELDDVDVIYEDVESGGRLIKLQKTSNPPAKPEPQKPAIIEKSKTAKSNMKAQKNNEEFEPELDLEMDMSAWGMIKLNPDLVKGLRLMKFQQPTDIQMRVIPPAIHKRRDIIGAAETGSGKTLAYGLAVLHGLLNRESQENEEGLPALILAPTRELAVQISNHLLKAAIFTSINVVSILGGMSLQRQKRLLSQKPDIIVATPGRFCQWMSEEDDGGYLSQLHKSVRFLVLDEADRMVEKGHFKDLTDILKALEPPKVFKQWDDETFELLQENKDVELSENVENGSVKVDRQTFVFSATMVRPEMLKSKGMDKSEIDESLESLLKSQITFYDKHEGRPLIVNLSSASLTAATLVESRIECLKDEKDLYVYYFLTRYPGRTIVFVNTIECIKRLKFILEALRVRVFPLHAHMQQRQRLLHLDRFKTTENAILLASDVASRGLDIPNVDHVIHYHMPRTADLYVHRSGRTARAKLGGISVMLCAPEELKSYKMICKLLNKPGGIPIFAMDDKHLVWAPLAQRVELAQEISRVLHSGQKSNEEDQWLRRMTKDMESDFDDSEFMSSASMGKNSKTKKQVVDEEDSAAMSQKVKATLNRLKQQLKQLMSRPILHTGSGSSYITANGPTLAKRLIANLNMPKVTTNFPSLVSRNALQDATTKDK